MKGIKIGSVILDRSWLIDWLVGWLIVWLVDGLSDWLIDCLIEQQPVVAALFHTFLMFLLMPFEISLDKV